ncbi:hypothetical protein GE061_012630 [Apolygus lucorum]|uniref:PAZ domain-containing protein n=1 Tax=Apolygus lucorum TaxID=248454 RepID=A0A8S9XSW7_APOLU|nr:hypothetical protein GE061_012630 [Apolygus lucorum]
MSDQPRSARRAAPRARGKPISQQQSETLSAARPGPPAPVQTQQAPTPRGRATIVASTPRPFPPADDVAKSLQAASLSESGSEEAARGTAERTRGSCRQRPVVELVTRPATVSCKQGKTGQSIMVQANYFSFKSYTDITLYQYRVDFQPDEERTIVRKAFLKPHKDELGPYLFDGTVLYTVTQILPDPKEFVTKRTTNDETVRIIIKKTTDCVMGDHHYLQVLNIIVRKAISALNLQLVGRDYYDPLGKVVLKDHNMEVWPGYVTSIRQHESEILMNVDVSSKVMRNDTALGLLQEAKDRSSGSWKEVFENAMIGATVITRYNNATYRVDDVDFESNPLSTFDMKGKKVSFKEYYREKYNLNIRFEDQPLLVSKPKAKDIRGGRDKNIILVPELCCMTGITDSMR